MFCPLSQQFGKKIPLANPSRCKVSSFTSYLRRQKDLGYHQELNLNLVRYVRRLLEIRPGDKKALKKLNEEIAGMDKLAEKTWLLSKCQF